MQTKAIEWQAQQVCGDCGAGVFVQRGPWGLPLCNHCDHEHSMDSSQLGEGEAFEWLPVWAPTLHVTAYSITEE